MCLDIGKRGAPALMPKVCIAQHTNLMSSVSSFSLQDFHIRHNGDDNNLLGQADSLKPESIYTASLSHSKLECGASTTCAYTWPATLHDRKVVNNINKRNSCMYNLCLAGSWHNF
jgi:hypothetical protein